MRRNAPYLRYGFDIVHSSAERSARYIQIE